MQDKQSVYDDLAKTFTPYGQIKNMPVRDNGELMVSLKQAGIPIAPYSKTLALSTGNDLYVRQSLTGMLKLAGIFIKAAMGDQYELQVTYAYRSPEIQKNKFIKVMAEEIMKVPDATQAQWIDNTHRYIACPDAAGHPTGGAVDVWIVDGNGLTVDMGTPTHTLSEDSYVFSPFITDAAKQNRRVLRDAMQKAGFSPFDGEWWHFSYGDKEWAVCNGKPFALYNQIDFDYKTGDVKPYDAPAPETLIGQAKRNPGL